MCIGACSLFQPFFDGLKPYEGFLCKKKKNDVSTLNSFFSLFHGVFRVVAVFFVFFFFCAFRFLLSFFGKKKKNLSVRDKKPCVVATPLFKWWQYCDGSPLEYAKYSEMHPDIFLMYFAYSNRPPSQYCCHYPLRSSKMWYACLRGPCILQVFLSLNSLTQISTM